MVCATSKLDLMFKIFETGFVYNSISEEGL